jgi:hypothetical protein
MRFSTLLARFELSDVSRSSQAPRDAASYLDFFLSVALVLATLAVAIYCWNRIRDMILQRGDSPQSLFQELCRVHRLTRPEMSLLMRAATTAALSEPAVAFVNPGVLESLDESPEATALSEKLFGRSK